MPLHNSDIAELLNKTADLLEIKGENRYRVRAYRNAARTVSSLSQNVTEKVSKNDDLSELPGIGEDLAGKIESIVNNGTFELLEILKEEIPEELSGLMEISNLGPKRVAKLYQQLDIKSLDALKDAVEKDKIKSLEGFGSKMQQQISQAIKRYSQRGPERMLLADAEEIIEPFIEYLKDSKGLKDITIAGSFRRKKETVGDIDILVTCKKDSEIADRFVNYEEVEKVVSKGKSKSTVLLRNGLQVDLRLIAAVSYGAALVYFTGSKEHNIEMRKIAVAKNLKINEYGVYKGDDRIAGKTEKKVYDAVGLNWVEPELRENRGEIQLAKKKKPLPKLIQRKNIKGDLHCHSNYTDGNYTIQQMAEAAKQLGYEYMAITDHSQRVAVAGGLNEKRLRKQLKEIDKINKKLENFRILKGIEVDILKDGSLDLPGDVLCELDLAVCSVHSNFNLSKKEQTCRVLKAMENPNFTIFGHPTGRLINSRDPYDIDIDKIIKAAADKKIFLEINSHPERLDLNDIHCKAAKEASAKMVISTDAHHTDGLENIRFGINQARRGWLQKADVINTLTLSKLEKNLKFRKQSEK